MAKMSTEFSHLPESQISCPANALLTFANVSLLAAAAVASALSRSLAPWLSAVRSAVLSPMHQLDRDRSYRSGYPRTTTFAAGASTRMVRRVASSRAGSWVAANVSSADTALRHELVDSSTQVSMVLAKPASLPPIVMLTSVVLGLSAETWLLRTSAVVAPEQATETKEVGELTAAHCSGYALVLRSQLPLDEM